METKRSEDGRTSLVFSVRGPIPIQMGKKCSTLLYIFNEIFLLGRRRHVKRWVRSICFRSHFPSTRNSEWNSISKLVHCQTQSSGAIWWFRPGSTQKRASGLGRSSGKIQPFFLYSTHKLLLLVSKFSAIAWSGIYRRHQNRSKSKCWKSFQFRLVYKSAE